MAEKKAWNVRADDQLIERCELLGKRFGMTGNEFAYAVLNDFAEVCADFMTELRDIKSVAISRQRDEVLQALRAYRESKRK